MNNLYLLCGKPGCGKTTLAKKLNKELGLIHLSADDVMLKLFGEIENKEIFDDKLKAVKNLIYEHCEQLLVKNDVVLYFGFWTKEERNNVKFRFKNANVILVYLNPSDDEILERIEKRNASLKNNEYFMDKATFKALSSKFEEPTADENAIIFSDNDDINKLKNIRKF